MNRNLRAVSRMMLDIGVSEFEIVQRSRHPAVTFEANNRRHTLTFAGTPSDSRSYRNFRAAVKRRLRE